jgi:alanyl-tRNA synthetase
VPRAAADRPKRCARGRPLPQDARARPELLDEEEPPASRRRHAARRHAFKLYDTYGFPLDLTQDALRGAASASTPGFDAAMARQKAEARAAWAGSGEAATETVWFELREKLGATEFLGYDTETAEGVITRS